MPRKTITRNVHKIDASGEVVGRLSTKIVKLLMGKHKASYQPNLDEGDFVHVENAGKVRFTGNKVDQKRYFHYSGYPGGMKARTVSDLMAVNPGRVLKAAVDRMLPKNKLRSRRLKRLVIK